VFSKTAVETMNAEHIAIDLHLKIYNISERIQ